MFLVGLYQQDGVFYENSSSFTRDCGKFIFGLWRTHISLLPRLVVGQAPTFSGIYIYFYNNKSVILINLIKITSCPTALSMWPTMLLIQFRAPKYHLNRKKLVGSRHPKVSKRIPELMCQFKSGRRSKASMIAGARKYPFAVHPVIIELSIYLWIIGGAFERR